MAFDPLTPNPNDNNQENPIWLHERDGTQTASGKGAFKLRPHGKVDASVQNCLRWDVPFDPNLDPPKVYERNSVVFDNRYLMRSNKQTSDRPAPQASGSPSWDLPDVPPFVQQLFTGVAWTGHEYTLTVPGWVKSWQAWVPELTSDTNYRFILANVTDPDNPIVEQREEPVLVAGQWTTVAAPQSIWAAGTKLTVIIDALNSGADTTVSGGWRRASNSNSAGPGSQEWNTRNNQATFRISKTDLDSVDRTSELAGIGAGSTVILAQTSDTNRSMIWSVDGDPTDQGTYFEWTLNSYGGPGIGGEPLVGENCTLTATIPTPSPTKYEEIVDHWLTPANVPTWATVRGLKRLGGVDQPADNNAYGIRVNFQPAYLSPDWDFLALS